ncbi:MAG: PLP-dependent aminotransferase family protein [Lachnospiraceae bacterium]|jgi:GntR family transcriptional regulator/MocR family aminotransferase|nr:PLP-dependent aminotransferase family protein [Lachnospiraceae bacterium]MDD3617603.1 PLP-dependent aminotransferase family protein [Lachnospiraceae bacterium]
MYELTIALDAKSKKPLYEQIYDHIKGEMLKGRMRPGERLPSTRVLSRYLQVSRSTVNLAYEQLLAEGYLESIPCKGYYVSNLELFEEVQEQDDGSLSKPEESRESILYDFALNGIDEDGFPVNQWRKISKKILDWEESSLFQLGDSAGEWGVRDAITQYIYRSRGVLCSPNQIIIGAGNDYLLMLLHVILKHNTVVAMENPTYKSAYETFQCLGFSVKGISMDTMGMQVDELEQSEASVAYVMPSHQFPMGYVMPVKRRLQLLNWAAKSENRYIIEDDYDSEFRYKGKPIPALQGLDRKDKVIYLGTFSKSIAPAIRFSYMVLPKSLKEKWDDVKKAFSVTISKVDQRIMQEFIENGTYERHLNRMRNRYRTKRDLMLSCMKKWQFPYVITGEDAGVHMVLHLPGAGKEQEIVERAGKHKILVYGLSNYYIRKSQQNQETVLLIGYATLREADIPAAMKMLGEVIENKL